MTRPQSCSRTIGIALALLTLLQTGCSRPFHLWDASTASIPRSESVTLAMLASDAVAVLAPITPPALKGYGTVLSYSLDEALARASKPIHTIPAYESLTRINRRGFAPDYQRMVAGFDEARLFDRQLLDRVGSALGARYVLQPGLAEFSQTLSTRLDLMGYIAVRTRSSTLRLWLQLWDAKTGEILWESAGEITVSTEIVNEIQVPLNDMGEKLWALMIEDLLGNKLRSKILITEPVQETKPEPALPAQKTVTQTPETRPEPPAEAPPASAPAP